MNDEDRRGVRPPPPALLRQMIQKSSCGVDPVFDRLPDLWWYYQQVDKDGYCIEQQTMWHRLCSKCNTWGEGACKPRETSTEPRTRVVLKRSNTMHGECPICFTDVWNCNVVHTKCNHVFHKSCFNKWVNTPRYSWDATCPVCRTILEPMF